MDAPHYATRPARLAALVGTLALLAGPSRALAQSQVLLQPQPTFDTSGSGLQVQVTRPSFRDDGLTMTCTYGMPNCITFNRAMCTDALQSTPVELAISRGSASITPTTNQVAAYAWLQRSNTICSTDFALTQNGNSIWPAVRGATTGKLIGNYSVLGGQAGAALLVPDAFDGDWPENLKDGSSRPTLTVGDIMHAFGDVCAPGGGVAYARWRLCVGVDLANTGIINPSSQAGNGTNSAQTPTGYLEFMVSTVEPAAPTVAEPVELYGRVRFSVTVDNNQQNLREVHVLAEPTDPNAPPQTDCSQLSFSGNGVQKTIGGQVGDTTIDVDVPGDNGTTYAYCVYTVDVVGTSSKAAGPFYARPEPESGVFGVWDDLRPGFGSCQEVPAAWPLGAIGWALARRARGRRRGTAVDAPTRPPRA